MSSGFYLTQLRRWILQSPPIEWGLQRLREMLIGAIRQGPVPRHIAFVMDGNRRFARQNKIETIEGHNMGFESLARVLEVCYKAGVQVVTIYAFSIENYKRTKREVDALMDMGKLKLTQLAQHGDLLDRYGACIRVLGQRELIRPDVLEVVDRAVAMTSHNKRAILNICFPYTSREEITTAIRETVADFSTPIMPPLKRPFSESHITRVIRARQLGTVPEENGNGHTNGSYNENGEYETSPANSTSSTTLQGTPENTSHLNFPDPEQITAETLTNHMYTRGTPPVDLLVRTSGVERLSDFLLWQCHQDTSVVFLECLWPEFDLWQFVPILVEWQWQQKKKRDELDRTEKIQRISGTVIRAH